MAMTTITDNATIVRYGKQFYHIHAEMVSWCCNTVGIGGRGPVYNDTDSVWMIMCNFGNTTFYFQNSGDALAFKLRFPCYATS